MDPEEFFGSDKVRSAPQSALISCRRCCQPFITSNPDLLEVIGPQLEAELRQHRMNKSLKEQTKGILKRSFPGGALPVIQPPSYNRSTWTLISV